MRKRKEPVVCRYNTGVECPEEGRQCKRCGWCPDVAAVRLVAILKKLGVLK